MGKETTTSSASTVSITPPSSSSLLSSIVADVSAIKTYDPALRHSLELLICYPGLWALGVYRIAHLLWSWEWYLTARFLSAIMRLVTAVDIHPAAQIGTGVVMDHATGIVVGETAIVGDGCVLYQGVTLGGTGKSRGVVRHPALGSQVVVGANASVLGPVQLGDRAKVGAGSVVTRDVGSGYTVVGIPGRALRKHQGAGLPDVDAEAFKVLFQRIERLERRVEDRHGDTSPHLGENDDKKLRRKGKPKDDYYADINDDRSANDILMQLIDGAGI
eukprot:gb/GECH01004012.1/.p1 GENE.gb/GECH01004012.1/~~gb/GECH01004012.1/.p1  ORF type:complete len:274 (+),score=66.04 gb/GECH01004012.1/:1-822(+)